jgi:RNA polymerase subunit RPABC4/transcription elongation factor Spt4
VKGNVCPLDKTSELTTSWRGMIVVINPDCEIAKAANITAPGKYASRIR